MRLTHLFNPHYLIEANLDSRAFQRWFRGSKVVNQDGTPMRVFHATDRIRKVNQFKSGTHFGTAAAARDRMRLKLRWEAGYHSPEEYRREWRKNAPSFTTLVGYLSIKNPITLWDDDDPLHSNKTRNFLRDKGILPKRIDHRTARPSTMIKYLIAHGYDGVRYRNQHESPGSIRWIIFQPKQFWRVFQNQPGVV